MPDYLQRNFALHGKTAVVTGAGRGIGRAIAEALGSVGARVLVHYNKSESAARDVVTQIQSNGGEAWMVQADLTISSQVDHLFAQVEQKWGSLDILVNNVGDMIRRSNIEDLSDELIDQVIRVNLHSVLYVTRAAIPLLKRAEEPCVVNVGSISAHTGAGNGATLYASTKGAIHTFTRGLAKELSPHVRVNAVAPGVILTDFHRKYSSEDELRQIAATTPLRRVGRPDEISAAVVFLCGKGASFITGEVIEINGGRWFA